MNHCNVTECKIIHLFLFDAYLYFLYMNKDIYAAHVMCKFIASEKYRKEFGLNVKYYYTYTYPHATFHCEKIFDRSVHKS